MRRVSYRSSVAALFWPEGFCQELQVDIFVGYSYERIGFANASAPTSLAITGISTAGMQHSTGALTGGGELPQT